ncbi:MAG: DUF3488 and DUF4129 domain-containing transglutaminase family protein [Alkaliphilus sp.]
MKKAHFVVSSLMVFTITTLFVVVLEVELNILYSLILVFLIAFALTLCAKHPKYFAMLLFGVALGVAMLNRYIEGFVATKLGNISQFIANIVNHIAIDEQILHKNAIPLLIVLVILVSIITLYIIFKTKKCILLMPLYLYIFFHYWYHYIDEAYLMTAIFLALFLILYASKIFTNEYHSEKRANEEIFSAEQLNITYKIWMKSSINYALIIFLVAFILPKHWDVPNLTWLNSFVANHVSQLLELRTDVEGNLDTSSVVGFDLAQMGFQEHYYALGGPVTLSDEIVMEVVAPIPLYLRGAVKTYYTGTHWTNTEITSKIIQTFDIISEYKQETDLVSIEITNVNMSSLTVFSPYRPVLVQTDKQEDLVVRDSLQLTLKEGILKGETYRVLANVDGLEIVESQALKFRYLQIPTTISQEVFDLSAQITENYDLQMEKAVAIKKYLRENFTYELNVSMVPKNTDFVEHFLFDTKEGYCTYFATAMIIMLRTQHIPARYVIGFRVVERNAEGVFEVRRNNAHAWVEAYIKGSGWVTFEPTPAFTAPDVALLNRFENRDERSRDTYFDEMLLLPQQRREIINREVEQDLHTAGEYTEMSPFMKRVSQLGWGEVFKWIIKNAIILFLILCVMRGIYCYLRIKRYYKKVRELDFSNASICLYDNILKLIQLQGLKYLAGETHYEYANRIKRETYDEKHSFYEITQNFVYAKYAREAPNQEEVEKMWNYLLFIENKLCLKIGKYKCMYKKYLAGNMYKIHGIETKNNG